MKNTKHDDAILVLVKDVRILMLTIKLDMTRHTLFKIPFSPTKRKQVYKELEEMQKLLASVDIDAMGSRVSKEVFVVFRAKFLMFEHEVIDFVNLFNIRVFGNRSAFLEKRIPHYSYP